MHKQAELIPRDKLKDVRKPLAFSHDGESLATAVGEQIVIWNADNLSKNTTLPDRALIVEFSPNRWALASARANGSVVLWDLRTRQSNVLVPRTDSDAVKVVDLDFSPDGTLLAVSRYDGTVQLHEVPSGNRRDNIVLATTNHGMASAFSHDGKLLAMGVNDIKLWSIEDQKIVGALDVDKKLVNGISFSRQGQLLAASTWKGLMVFDFVRGQTIQPGNHQRVSLDHFV